VICLVSVFVGLLSASGQFVSPRVAGNLARDLALEALGGNAVLIIYRPISEFGDPCCKKFDNCCCEFLFGWTTTVLTYSFYTRANAVDLWSHVSQ